MNNTTHRYGFIIKLSAGTPNSVKNKIFHSRKDLNVVVVVIKHVITIEVVALIQIF